MAKGGMRFGRFVAVSILILDVVGTVVAWHFTREQEMEIARDHFNAHAEQANLAIRKRLLDHELILRGGLGLLNGSHRVERDEWRGYISSLKLEENFPGIQGVGFSKWIRPEEKNAHLAQVRAEGFPNYRIWPEGDRPQYTSIIYLEPFVKRNLRAFGYDMFSEPVRREAMSMAGDSGIVTISGKVKLVQETETDIQHGILMYVPFYRRDARIETVEERRASLAGFVYSPYRMKDLMRGILGDNIKDIDIEIYDSKGMSEESVLYRAELEKGISHANNQPLFQSIFQVNAYGRDWTIQYHSLPAFDSTLDRRQSLLVLAVGLFITLMLGWHLVHEGRQSERLERSETQYRMLFEQNPHPMWIFDRETLAFLAVNDAAVKHYGYSREEFVRLTVRDIRPKEDIPALQKYLETLRHLPAASGAFQAACARHLKKDGTVIDVDITFSPISFQSNDAMLVLADDVTERRRLEQDIHRTMAILAATTDLVGMADKKGGVFYLNKAGRRMLGIGEQEDILGTLVYRYHPAWANDLLKNVGFPSACREGVWSGELAFLSRNGKEIPTLMSLIAHKSANGEIEFFSTISRDITERKRAERAITEAKNYTENIVRNMVDTLIVVNADATIRSVNQETLHLLGYDEKELVGQPVGMIFEDEKFEKFAGTGLRELIEKGSGRNLDVMFRTKSGERVPVSLAGSAMRDDEGKLAAIVCIAHDMRQTRRLIAEADSAAAAERHRADELRKAYVEMEQLNRELKSTQAQLVQAGKMTALGQLAGGIAHEMNQPLTAILGLSKLLKGKLPAGSEQEKVAFIEEQGHRLADIVEHVRSFARPSPAQPAACSVRQHLDEVLTLIRSNLTDHNIQVKVDISEDLPPVRVVCNQIQQVFLNLITNAMEAIEESDRDGGKIEITAMEDRSAGQVRVSFRNDGPPIGMAVRSQIFDPFFTTKQAGKGMGLGLPISFNIVNEFGGKLELVEDGLPEIHFRVSLPVFGVPSPLTEYVETGPPASDLWLNLSGVRVLVVDDDVAVRETLRMELTDQGLQPTVVSSGEEALDRAARESFDVVLTDLKMPGMDGVRLIEELRVRHVGLPVMAMTGWADADLIDRARRAGAGQIVPKPIPSDAALAEALTNCLEARRVRA